MIRKWLIIALLPFPLFGQPLDVKVECPAAILINGKTGAVLFEKGAREARYPASLTKIATCVFALKQCKDQLTVPVEAVQDCIGAVSENDKRKSGYKKHPPHWLVFDGCHIGIKRGEILSLNDLLHGMMIASADDASNIIAHHLGGSVPNFMEKLNQEMVSWGCKDSLFLNPHGLHHPDHKASAYDIALMAKEGMKDPLFRKMVSTVTHTRPKTNKQEATPLVQTNRLLKKGPHKYEHALGIKTGYTSDAGYCLASAAEKGDRFLIAVVMGAKENSHRYQDTKALFEAAFQEAKVTKTLLQTGPQEIRINNEKLGKIHTVTKEPLQLTYYPSEEVDLKLKLHLNELGPKTAPGDVVGTLCAVDLDGVNYGSIPLYISHFESPKFSLLYWAPLALLLFVPLIFFRKRRPVRP